MADLPSLWIFHAKDVKGGSNPSLRTVFHRTVALLQHPVSPIFVFGTFSTVATSAADLRRTKAPFLQTRQQSRRSLWHPRRGLKDVQEAAGHMGHPLAPGASLQPESADHDRPPERRRLNSLSLIGPGESTQFYLTMLTPSFSAPRWYCGSKFNDPGLNLTAVTRQSSPARKRPRVIKARLGMSTLETTFSIGLKIS